jgi:P27 family predicted phage terminase small subunit
MLGAMPQPKTGTGGGVSATPIERKRLKGSRIRTGLAASPMPETALALVDMSVVPKMPTNLGLVGQDYWTVLWTGGRRHLSELHDAPLMNRLCRNFDKIYELENWLGTDVTNRWYTSPNGQVVTHPAVKQIEQMDAQNTAWLSLLGFTPSDRARLGLAEIRVANELDAYRQRKSNVVDAEVVPN